MTVTDAQALDLGRLAVIAESFTNPDGPIAVDVGPVDELQPTPGSRAWTILCEDTVVVLVQLGDPAPDMVAGLLAHFGNELGAVSNECEPEDVTPPVAPSAVGIRDGAGNGFVAYLTPNVIQAMPTDFDDPADDMESGGFISLGMLREVPLEVSAELGRTRMSVAEILQLNVGSVVELDRAAGSPVDVVVNGSLIARGEVVVIDEEYGVRITEILGRVGDTL